MSDAPNAGSYAVSETPPIRLRDALRQARIEAADRTGVVVDLRDAEVARLEILNEALDPLFGQIPDQVDLFDRGISQGDTPRLWIDVVAHVLMGRDKRIYRFVQDTRFGRVVIAESHDVAAIVAAVTDYVRAAHDRARTRADRDCGAAADRDGKAASARLLDVRGWLPRRCGRAVRSRLVRGPAEFLDQPNLLQLLDAKPIVHASNGLLDAPRRAIAFDRKQIVGGRGIVPVCDR